jgi:DNA-binding LacI/PurR family transcriptional regulator
MLAGMSPLPHPQTPSSTPSPRAHPDSPPTINDLARSLNISSTTVWRALNNSPRVSQRTRQRVMQAAEKMNYRPSLVAQTLLRGKTQTLGMIVPMIGNPVYAALVHAVELVAFEHKYNVILCDTNFELGREKEYADLLVRRRVEGAIIVPFAARSENTTDSDHSSEVPHGYAHLAELTRQGIAVVAMQQPIPGAQLDSVVPENRAGARAITEHLIQHGHKRIGYLHGGTPDWHPPMHERFEGFRDALKAAGIEFDESLGMQVGSFPTIMNDGGPNFDPDKVEAYLRRPDRPTAVCAPVDIIAVKVLAVARDRVGLRVPEDLAIVGFDDIQAASHCFPRLTTVRHPSAQIGRRAAELLFERIKSHSSNGGGGGGEPEPFNPVHERVPCELVIRQSCGAHLSSK